MPTTLNCPTCHKQVEWNDKFPYKPFCSYRCKLIDLGDWSSENHKIPGQAPDFLEDNPDENLGENGVDSQFLK